MAGQTRRRLLTATLGSGAVIAALPASARADAEAGAIGPGGESGLRLDELLLYRGGFHGGGGTSNNPGFVFEPGFLTLDSRDLDPVHAAEIHFLGPRGHWVIAQDVANHGGGGKDFVIAAQRFNLDGPGSVEDVVFLTPGPNGSRVGIGRTPPTQGYRLETGGLGTDGGFAIVMGENATGNVLGAYDSSGRLRLRIDPGFRLEFRDRDTGTAFTIGTHNGRLAVWRDGEEIPLGAPADTSALEQRIAELEAIVRDNERSTRRLIRRLRRRIRRRLG